MGKMKRWNVIEYCDMIEFRYDIPTVILGKLIFFNTTQKD